MNIDEMNEKELSELQNNWCNQVSIKIHINLQMLLTLAC